MWVYLAPKILVIDEVGYLPFDTLGATMLFQWSLPGTSGAAVLVLSQVRVAGLIKLALKRPGVGQFSTAIEIRRREAEQVAAGW